MTALNKLQSLKISAEPLTALLSQTIEQAFPEVDPGERPCGSLLLVQIKQPAVKTKGGIELSNYDIETEFDNTKIAKVLALGPLAYHTRDKMEPWPEGAWTKIGEYVRISTHNAKQWTVALPGTRGASREDRITFGLIDDLLIGSIVNDPMATRAFF